MKKNVVVSRHSPLTGVRTTTKDRGSSPRPTRGRLVRAPYICAPANLFINARGPAATAQRRSRPRCVCPPPLFGADVPIALFPEGATGCDSFASKTTRGPHAAERRAKKISITYVRFSDETVERDRHGENGESIVGSAGSRYQSIDTRNVSWSGYKVSVCTRVIACVTTRDDG